MAKGTNQKLKLYYLMNMFYNETDQNHKLSMDDILKRLAANGISAERKSIYDDIDTLKSIGFDIVSGKIGRGYKYYLASREFELAELKILTDLVESSKFLTTRKTQELVKKLKKQCSKYEGVQLERPVYLSERVKNMNETIYYTVDGIHNAMTNDKNISFTYVEYNIKKETVERHSGKPYKVSPWRLVCDNGNYYLVAYDTEADKIKHFRVDKMRRVVVASTKRSGEDEYKAEEASLSGRCQFSMFSGKEMLVEIVFDKMFIGVIIDRFGKNAAVQNIDDERFLFKHIICVSDKFLGWLFSMRVKAKDIKTAAVREKYEEILKQCLSE